jgi:hypothetical protein
MARALVLFFVLVVGLPFPGKALAATDVEAIFREIEDAKTRLQDGDRSLGPSLDRDIALIDTLLSQGAPSPEAAVVARYYRALARYYKSELDGRISGGVYDRALARAILGEFDEVGQQIDALADANGSNWRGLKANAIYLSGSLSYAQLGDATQAFRYWTRCAELDHAGCLNNMATARTTGEGGIAVDLTEALRIHKRVFETVTRFGCSGVYSAYSAALLVGLGGVRNTKDNAEIWIENAGNLLHVLQADQPGREICGGTDIQLARYLIELAHGRKNTALLDEVTAHKTPRAKAEIAAYLKGEVDDASFQAKMAAYPEWSRCSAYFFALWAADVAHDPQRAKTFQGLLARAEDLTCKLNLAYARSLATLQ